VRVNDVSVTAAQKNNQKQITRTFVMFLHIKLVKLVNLKIWLRHLLWPDLSFQIRQNAAPAGFEKINPVQPSDCYCRKLCYSPLQALYC